MNYDSTSDTQAHISNVRCFLLSIMNGMIERVKLHDSTKLESPEKEVFDEYTPKLKDSTYGSDEYKEFLKGMGKALDHHYMCNSHHPEHFEHGVGDMTLIDLIEMLADWKAATMRHANGDIVKSIEINKGRFNISDQLTNILKNTAASLGYVDDK